MKKSNPIYSSSIFLQAVFIVIGFTLIYLALSVYLFRQNMRTVLLNEVGKKAKIYLSATEASVRRALTGREPHRLSELFENQSKLLGKDLNFAIIRGAVLDPEGRILDHTRPEKIGQIHTGEDFFHVMATGESLMKREVKILRQEPGMPEISVIKVVHPVRNRKGNLIGAIKVDLDVRRTFKIIQEEYRRFNRRAVIGFALASIFLIFGTLFFLRRKIIGPVLTVAKASSRVASGDLEIFIAPRGRNEIDELIRSFNQMVDGLKERDFIRETFGRYMDHDVAKELMRRPEASRLGGEKREVAILISDIRGFTSLSKSLSPETIINILNRYFSHMIEVIQKYKGIIVDFFGDGVLVFFDPIEDPVRPVIYHAVRCALEVQEKMVHFNVEMREEGLPEFQTGIGVNAGEVVVGNIGSQTRAKYGIVGSPVNITQRIQSMAQGGDVVISESVYHHLEEDLIIKQSFRGSLKGIQDKVNLYVVEDLSKIN